MSKLKQVLQLHENGISNRSIALQLGLYKETVNKYIRQFKALSLEVQELLQKDDPKLEVSLMVVPPPMWIHVLMTSPSDCLIWKQSLTASM